MARPKATPEQRAEIRRTIQKAAAALYRAEGLGGISARAVAKDAGVSVGAIYAHFGDLTGLMQSLWTGHVERQNQKFETLAAAHKAPLERIRALLKEYLSFGTQNAELYRSAFLFVRPESHDAPQPAPPASTPFAVLLSEAIEQGQAEGSIVKGDAHVMMQLLWSGLHGAIGLPTNFDRLDFAAPGDVAEAMVEMLIRAVRV